LLARSTLRFPNDLVKSEIIFDRDRAGEKAASVKEISSHKAQLAAEIL